MRALIAAGGTAGHVMPALAVADALRAVRAAVGIGDSVWCVPVRGALTVPVMSPAVDPFLGATG